MKPYQKITLMYFLFGAAWIFLSDRIIELFTFSNETLTKLQTYKGWFFISLTSLMLFTTLRRAYIKRMQQQKEKEDLFYSVMKAVHHILNNFLNKMLFFKLAAEENKNFKEDVLSEYERVIRETSVQIQKLGDIENITEEEIEKTVFRDEQKTI
jgi:hypothetical protein